MIDCNGLFRFCIQSSCRKYANNNLGLIWDRSHIRFWFLWSFVLMSTHSFAKLFIAIKSMNESNFNRLKWFISIFAYESLVVNLQAINWVDFYHFSINFSFQCRSFPLHRRYETSCHNKFITRIKVLLNFSFNDHFIFKVLVEYLHNVDLIWRNDGLKGFGFNVIRSLLQTICKNGFFLQFKHSSILIFVR